MASTHCHYRETVVPESAIVHLSGSRRGTTEFRSGDNIVIASPLDGEVQISASSEPVLAPLATLDWRGSGFASNSAGTSNPRPEKPSIRLRGAIALKRLGADPVEIGELDPLAAVAAEEEVLPVGGDPRPVLF